MRPGKTKVKRAPKWGGKGRRDENEKDQYEGNAKVLHVRSETTSMFFRSSIVQRPNGLNLEKTGPNTSQSQKEKFNNKKTTPNESSDLGSTTPAS